jgi:hypothetical protein
MNANELANLLEVDSWYKLVTREEIATMLRQQQDENEALKSLFNNCRVSDFTPPQKAIIRQGFEAIWDEMIAKEPWPEITEMINDELYKAVQEEKK